MSTYDVIEPRIFPQHLPLRQVEQWKHQKLFALASCRSSRNLLFRNSSVPIFLKSPTWYARHLQLHPQRRRMLSYLSRYDNFLLAMAKRSREPDSSVLCTPSDKMQKSGGRSHEENQERAYVAASRRSDRSIEARIQSARLASAVHKKRTGRGFRLSEEIVQNEDMYEEEEDERSTGYLAIPERILAESTRARQQEIDLLFANQFPYAPQVAQQIANSLWPFSMSPANAGQFRFFAAYVPEDTGCPSLHQWGQLCSKDAQSLADSSSSQPLSPKAVLDTQAEENPSLPALTPPSSRSDSTSSSTSSPALSLAMNDFLFSEFMAFPDETHCDSMLAAEFPVDLNFITSDANKTDISIHSGDVQPINEGCDSMAGTSAPLVQTVSPGALDSRIQSSGDLNISGLTSGDNDVLDGQEK